MSNRMGNRFRAIDWHKSRYSTAGGTPPIKRRRASSIPTAIVGQARRMMSPS